MEEQYLLYLRKSRKDRELELQTGDFDTLGRHRQALLALARERGYHIAAIFEEVVTGDTILERPEMQKLLAAVETGQYAGVLVMEVPRLARGNTRDQGIVAETFQYSGCKIITPEKLYDPANESDEEYFEFGLFMSRREYKTINRRLGRGRLASLQEGKYIASCAPYGYEKYKLPRQKGYSLRIVPQEAEIVRHIFSLYTGNGSASGPGPLGSAAVADQLNREGVDSPGGVSWSAHTVRDILKNPVYCGLVRWSYRPASKKVVQGQVTVSTPVSKAPTIVQGLHEPIISQTQFQQAQEQLRRSFHAPLPGTQPLKNPLAGLIFCCHCGRAMVQQKDSRSGRHRLACPTPGCPTVSARTDLVETQLLSALTHWGGDCQLRPELEQADPQAAQARATAVTGRLRRQQASIRQQLDRLYDLLEQGVYTQEVFQARQALLEAKLLDLQRNLDRQRVAPAQQEQAAVPAALELGAVLGDYFCFAPDGRNLLLKQLLDKVYYQKDGSTVQLYVSARLCRPGGHSDCGRDAAVDAGSGPDLDPGRCDV